MNLLLESLKRLMRGSEGLPDNMSETEIRHYASEVRRRLQRGVDVETLALYLRGIDTSSLRHFGVSASTHELAQQAHVLFKTRSHETLLE